MKILLITACLPDYPNKGEKIRTISILEALAEMGTVDLVTISHEKPSTESLESFNKHCNSSINFTISKFSALKNACLAFLLNRSITHSYFYSQAAKNFLAELSPTKYDLIFVVSGNIFLNVKQLFGKKLFWDLIDLDSNKWLHYSKITRNFFLRYLYKREYLLIKKAEEKIQDSCAATFVISARELKQQNDQGQKLIVLPPALPKAYKAKVSKTYKTNLIVFSGQMNYLPNMEACKFLYHKVWPILKKESQAIKIKIIGRNASKELIKECSEFEFTGAVQDSSEHISEALAYVFPPVYFTGAPTKILEAIACGTPLITNSEIADIYNLKVEEHYLQAEDENEIAKCILEIAASKELRSRLSENLLGMSKHGNKPREIIEKLLNF